MNGAEITISYHSGRWVAKCNRWVLRKKEGFERLERLLAELATMGVRNSVSIDWTGLPAADEFNQGEFNRAARNYIGQVSAEALDEHVRSGYWLIAAAVMLHGRLEYSFYISSANQADWADSIRADGKCAAAATYVAPVNSVTAPKNYVLEKIQSLSRDIKNQISSRNEENSL